MRGDVRSKASAVLRELIATAVAGVGAMTALVRYLEPRFAFFPDAGESATPAELGLAFESSTIATADGERLRAWTLTHALPRAAVVYFHGNDVAPADADTYWTAVRTFIDQLGRM